MVIRKNIYFITLGMAHTSLNVQVISQLIFRKSRNNYEHVRDCLGFTLAHHAHHAQGRHTSTTQNFRLKTTALINWKKTHNENIYFPLFPTSLFCVANAPTWYNQNLFYARHSTTLVGIILIFAIVLKTNTINIITKTNTTQFNFI